MAIETKQLHTLSKIYQEAVYGGAKKEAPKDTRMVVTAADKKANTKAYQNYKAGNKAYKAADHLKNEEFVDEKVATGPRLGEPREKGATYPNAGEGRKIQKRTKDWMDKKGLPGSPGLDAEKAREAEHRARRGVKKEGFSDWRQDLKEIPDYEQIPSSTKKRNEKISEKNVKNSVKINPTMEEEFNSIEEYADTLNESDIADILARLEKKRISKGGDPDESPLGKKTGRAMKSQQDKARKKAGLKTEETQVDEGIGRAIKKGARIANRYIKDVTDDDPGRAHTIGSLGNPHGKNEGKKKVKEEIELDEGVYEKQKTKEVMGALKKRDLKTDVKKKIAADIVKKKGDTSKSDDRYAYEDHVWDKVADMLTELGKLNDVQFKVEGYQRNPEEGEKKANKKYEKVRGERTPMPPRGNKRREDFERWYAANVR